MRKILVILMSLAMALSGYVPSVSFAAGNGNDDPVSAVEQAVVTFFE